MIDSDLIALFPEYRKKIPILLAQDSDFLEVAEDYMICKKELKRQNSGTNKIFIQQYKQIVKDLKEELESYLKHSEI